MTAKIYHWTGENPNIHTSSANSVVFVETGNSGNERIEIATDVARFGDESFHIGYVDAADNSVNPPTYYRRRTYLNASGTIDTVGQGDFALAFWWKPTSESFYSEGGNHKTIIHSHLGMMSSYAAHGHSLTNYDIRWYAPYGDDTPDVDQYVAKTYQINLTGMPWIHIYASRIGETLRFVLSDINGDVFVDNSGNDCDWSYTGQASKRHNISENSYFRVGGGGSGTSNIGYYDDIVLVQKQSLSYDDLDLTRPIYISGEPIDPVIHSFSTSDTTVNSGESATLSWEDYYSESLQLQKYIGGVLNSTEAVTGNSKSVTINQAVSYKLRTTNSHSSADSSFLNISLGGSEMAIVQAVSGSEPAQSMQVNVNLLGGVSYDDATGRVDGLLVGAAGSGGRTSTNALSASFGEHGQTIIKALNHLKAAAAGQASSGTNNEVQITDNTGGFTSDSGFTYASNVLKSEGISGSANLEIGGTSELGSLTSVAISNAGLVSIENATAASSKTTGALQVAGGISTQTLLHVGTGLTVDAGGITVTAGASEFGAGATFAGSVTASKDVSVGESLAVTGPATVGGALGVVGLSSFTAGATFAASVTASKDLSVGESLIVTGPATVGGSVRVSGSDAGKDFASLPKFIIQGTEASGDCKSYHIAVSGGMLRAIATA